MSQQSSDLPEEGNPRHRTGKGMGNAAEPEIPLGLQRTIGPDAQAHPTDSLAPDQTVELSPSLDLPAYPEPPQPGSPAAVARSVLLSRDISRSLTAADFVDPDAALWGNLDQQSSDGASRLPPAIQRSLSESRLTLRSREIAAEKSPPGTGDTADYRLVRMIGKGGMGNVYVARQGSLDRLVALKVIKPLEGSKRKQLEESGELERVEQQRRLQFISEAVVTGDLEHPNIVPIHDIAIASDGTLFYSMRRVTGTPWSKVMQEKSRDENLEILLKVCDAVGFAHTRGVVHRDIKPDNIMLGEFGVVTVMDWGLALAKPDFEKRDAVLQPVGLGGSPAYMAPEMATGPVQRIGPPSDIYLLGATLFQIITGFAPHHGENVRDCLRAVAANEIREVPPGKQGELLDIALQAMATDPEERYRDVRSLQDAIREYRSHSESTALTGNAYVDLRRGILAGSYTDFARARFGFEQALALWPGNRRAASGLEQANIEYAEAAYRNREFDLGLAHLDASNTSHQPLIEKLRRGQRERRSRQRRMRLLHYLVRVLLVFILVGGAVALYVIQRSRQQALSATKEAQHSAELATEKSREAEKNAELAREQMVEAEKQAVIADYESYVSRIGLIKARVDQNEFNDAGQLLGELREERREQLGWEWRWLSKQARQSQSDLSTQRGVLGLAIAQSGNLPLWLLEDGAIFSAALSPAGWWLPGKRIEPPTGMLSTAIAISADGLQAALATVSGSVEIWNADFSQRIHQFATPASHIAAMVYTPGGLLVTAGNDRSARLWDPATGEELAVCTHRGPLSNVAVSTYGDEGRRLRMITAVAEPLSGYAACWDLTPPEDGNLQQGRWSVQSLGAFHGHADPVLCVAISPEGDLAASGDAAGQCLIWQPGNVEQSPLRLGDRSHESASNASNGGDSPPSPAHQDAIRSLAFDAQGDLLLSGADDYTLKLWNTARGTLLRTLRGHGGGIRGAGFAASTDPSHPVVVSGSSDTTIRSWQPRQFLAEPIDVLDMLGGGDESSRSFQELALSQVRFDTSGTLVVAASRDQTATVMRLDKEKQSFSKVAVLKEDRQAAPQSPVAGSRAISAVLDRSDRRIYVAGADAVVRVWDVRSALEIGQLDAVGSDGSLALTPQGRFLVTGSSDPDVDCILWELHPGSGFAPRILREFRGHAQDVTALAISPDGATVFSADRNGVGILWTVSDEQDTRRRLELGSAPINAAAFSQDGMDLWIAADDHELKRVRVDSGQTVAQYRHDGPVKQLSLSADDRFAVTLSEQRRGDWVISRAVLWDAHSGQQRLVHERRHAPSAAEPLDEASQDLPPGRIVSASFGSSPARLILGLQGATGEPASVGLWQLGPSGAVRPIAGFELPTTMGELNAAIPIAADAMMTLGKHGVDLWDLAAQSHLKKYRPSGRRTLASFSSDSRFIAVAGGTVAIWDVAGEQVAARLTDAHDGPVYTALFSPAAGSSRLATAGQDGTIGLWDWNAETGEISSAGGWKLSGSRRPIRSLAFSPDERWLLAVGDQGVVRLMATDGTGTSLVYDVNEGAGMTSAAFRSDATWFAVGGSDAVTRIWPVVSSETQTPEPILLKGHAGAIEDVRFLEDGTQELRVLTASTDRSARVWDPRIGASERLGRELLALRRHREGVTGIDVSPDAQIVITAGADAQLLLWPAEPPPAPEKGR